MESGNNILKECFDQCKVTCILVHVLILNMQRIYLASMPMNSTTNDIIMVREILISSVQNHSERTS